MLKQFVGEIKRNAVYKIDFGNSPLGNITRIDNVLNSLEKELKKAEKQLETIEKQLSDAKQQLGKPFVHEEELKIKTSRLTEITKLLDIDAQKENNDLKAEITDAYYMEVTPEKLQKLEKSNANYERCDNDGHIIIKINRCDKDKIHGIISNSKQSKETSDIKPKI